MTNSPIRRGWWISCSAQKGLAKVKDNKIVIRRDWVTDRDRIRGAFAIARDLAQAAKRVAAAAPRRPPS
jgi:hypothetical protein